MTVHNGVSDSLLVHIQSLMALDCLSEFNLGGGTSLAIKYNHRVSTDIDLFSPGVVGIKCMLIIADEIKRSLKPDYIKVLNESHDNLCFLRAILPPDETKVEIIQNPSCEDFSFPISLTKPLVRRWASLRLGEKTVPQVD